MKEMKDELSFSEKREKMVRDQIIQRGINDERVLESFRNIPRHIFVPEKYRAEAYTDHPLPIGESQTISQPYIVALMTSYLFLSGNEKVLEVGTGSGYQTAILADLVREVYSIELIQYLSNLAEKKFQDLQIRNIFSHIGDGSMGWQEHAPYDRIIITAAIPELTEEIKAQVVEGGRIIAPIGGRWRQVLTVWERKNNSLIKEQILPVVFVPLRGEHGWQE